MSAPLRVAMVCPYGIDLPGGVQSQVIGLSKALLRAGVEVGVIAPGKGADRCPPGAEYFGVGRTIPVPVNGSRAPIAPFPTAFRRTARAVQGYRPNVVHIQEPFVPGASLGALLSGEVPKLGTFHRAGAGLGYRAGRLAWSAFLRRLEDVVAVSEEARSTLVSVAGSSATRCTVIENGVDVERFSSGDTWSREGLTIMFNGRHERRKGLGVLLEAFCSSTVSAALWIVSDGPLTENLRARYGADPRLEWCGHIDDDELAKRLRAADVFVAPSLGGESFGVVLLEAMAASAAVLASDLPGYHLAAGEVARYFPPGDVNGLRVSLEQLCADAELRRRLGEEGLERARQHDFAQLAQAYCSRYEQLL